MLECHYSLPAREKIAQMQKTGASDQSDRRRFRERKSGWPRLPHRPPQGFNLLGWVMPFIAILRSGSCVIAMWFKRFARPRAASRRPELLRSIGDIRSGWIRS